MQITKTHKIIISIIAVAILFGAYVAFDKRSKEMSKQNEDLNVLATSTDTKTGQSNSTSTPNYTIKIVPVGQSSLPQPIPDLNRPSGSSGTVAEKILSLQASLKKKPADFNAWLELASYQKIAGDYGGAVISWTYASKLDSNDYIALGNIGNLYAYYIKDSVKSEMYYKQAISRNPNQPYLYTQLAEVYRDLFKDIAKARAIIDQGLSKIPNDPNLLEFKASLN